MNDRTSQICYSFTHGATLQQIAEQHAISRERVRQIIKKQGIQSCEGGHSVQLLISGKYRQIRNHEKNQRISDVYGCPVAEAERLNEGLLFSDKHSFAIKYRQQRTNARNRGIEWRITFPEWVSVWKASGMWNKRGRGFGYVMSRIGDTGAYEANNVEIVTQSQNMKDYNAYARAH